MVRRILQPLRRGTTRPTFGPSLIKLLMKAAATAPPRPMNAAATYGNLGIWWEACQLATIVLPSSAMSERVFSLDVICLGLMLAYNSK